MNLINLPKPEFVLNGYPIRKFNFFFLKKQLIKVWIFLNKKLHKFFLDQIQKWISKSEFDIYGSDLRKTDLICELNPDYLIREPCPNLSCWILLKILSPSLGSKHDHFLKANFTYISFVTLTLIPPWTQFLTWYLVKYANDIIL